MAGGVVDSHTDAAGVVAVVRGAVGGTLDGRTCELTVSRLSASTVFTLSNVNGTAVVVTVNVDGSFSVRGAMPVRRVKGMMVSVLRSSICV